MTRCITISVAILFILAVFFSFWTRREKASDLRIKVVPSSLGVSRVAPSLKSAIFDSESYYRLIIENNLFCPLGWMPPVRVEPYRLIGTRIVRDGETPPQAIRCGVFFLCSFSAGVSSSYLRMDPTHPRPLSLYSGCVCFIERSVLLVVSLG